MSLVRVKEQDGGVYTLKAYNEDDNKNMTFYLQINGEFSLFMLYKHSFDPTLEVEIFHYLYEFT